ncbi:MAG: EVE domain-containing protein [Candidatus Methanoperedens sp.]|nr:EVE domain-containing protein [Candidatus Methanoperedens sp.]
MNYWICILNRENFNIVIQKQIWGVAERYKNLLSKVKVGDRLIFYITKESVFGGVSEVASDGFIDEEDIFLPIKKDRKQKFPFRIKIKPVIFFKKMTPIEPLIIKLDFIKNKKRFQVHFMGKAMIPIGEKDINTIMS